MAHPELLTQARKDSHRCSSNCGPECQPCEDAKALGRELAAATARAEQAEARIVAVMKWLTARRAERMPYELLVNANDVIAKLEPPRSVEGAAK